MDIPNDFNQARAGQRRAVIHIYGCRTRAVGIHRKGPLYGFLKEVPRDARGLSAAECPRFVERDMLPSCGRAAMSLSGAIPDNPYQQMPGSVRCHLRLMRSLWRQSISSFLRRCHTTIHTISAPRLTVTVIIGINRPSAGIIRFSFDMNSVPRSEWKSA